MTNILAVGIDPGLDGAIAVYRPEQADPELRLAVYPMPTREIKVTGKTRREVDASETLRLARRIWNVPVDDLGAEWRVVLAIEKVHGLPGQSGSAAFNFGYGTAIASCAFSWTQPRGTAALLVTPQRWKGEVGIHIRDRSNKDASRERASELFPSHAHLWKAKTKDGWAEAALIAYWAAQQGEAP